jgi:hypothetical protein
VKKVAVRRQRPQPAESTTRDLSSQDTEVVRERIAKTAYDMYEQRGRQDGRDLEDWIKAEAMVKGEPA